MMEAGFFGLFQVLKCLLATNQGQACFVFSLVAVFDIRLDQGSLIMFL